MAVVLCVPTLTLLAAVLAAGARYNGQHEVQRALLTHQRLLLRERALLTSADASATALSRPHTGTSFGMRNRRTQFEPTANSSSRDLVMANDHTHALDWSVDDMLRIAAKVVMATPRCVSTPPYTKNSCTQCFSQW